MRRIVVLCFTTFYCMNSSNLFAQNLQKPPPGENAQADAINSSTENKPTDSTNSITEDTSPSSKEDMPKLEEQNIDGADHSSAIGQPMSEATLMESHQSSSPRVQPEEKDKLQKKKSVWEMVKLELLWYLSYAHGETADKRFNKASIGRGYTTLKIKPVSWFEPRITLDTHQDDEGSWGVRLKYLYAKFVLPVETPFITEPNLEIGLVHTPWFDFEEHVNNYRMEGTMFIERNGLLNSADAGATLGGLLGRKLPKTYQEQVSSKYPGQWGSFALGLYNGGGYHAKETNNDKVFMSRITLRPLGLVLPNLQISHFFIYGKGNTAATPDWLSNDIMLSFEHQYFVLTGQYAAGKGNQKGSMVATDGEALDFKGFSFFGELKAHKYLSSVIARFDHFDWDVDGGDPATNRFLAGYAFHFYKHCFALLSLDHLTYVESNNPSDWQVKLTVQVKL